jgi:hypothetical protein
VNTACHVGKCHIVMLVSQAANTAPVRRK